MMKISNEIEFSQRDVLRNITLPNKLDSKLAELIGVLMGDGHIGIYADKTRNNKVCRYQIHISGHMLDDYLHHHYVNALFKDVFNVQLKINVQVKKNALYSTIGSKAIALFFKSMEFPMRNKSNSCAIPPLIFCASQNAKAAFLRGVFDTDGTLTFKERKKTNHSYPVIKLIFKSEVLVEGLRILLTDLNIYFTSNIETSFDKRFDKWFTKYAIYIRGHKNLSKWINQIGFSNHKHITKHKIWKKFGFCPPYTTIKQREYILIGILNPSSFYKNNGGPAGI